MATPDWLTKPVEWHSSRDAPAPDLTMMTQDQATLIATRWHSVSRLHFDAPKNLSN
jgi:hypothetical protein